MEKTETIFSKIGKSAKKQKAFLAVILLQTLLVKDG